MSLSNPSVSSPGASGGFRTGPPPQPPPSAAPAEDQKISKQILNKKLKEHARQVMVTEWLLNGYNGYLMVTECIHSNGCHGY